MSKKAVTNQLADKHYITLVIRLLIDQQGQLQSGVVVDLNEKQIGKFRQLSELPNMLERWLAANGSSTSAPNYPF